MNTKKFQSPPVPPATCWDHEITFPPDMRIELELDAPTAAHFTIERIDRTLVCDPESKTPRRWSCHYRVRNHSDAPQYFAAVVVLLPDPRPLADRVLELASEEWASHQKRRPPAP